MRQALSDLTVHIARPVKSGEIKVTGLDEAVTPEQIAPAIAGTGGCAMSDVRAGELRRSRSGMFSAWVRCPLTAVRKLHAAKHIVVSNWISAKVEVLEVRPMRCYRCLEPGHVGRQCPSENNRSDCCFTCGQKGHKAEDQVPGLCGPWQACQS
ncbi:uncharacterized protein LOC113235360 [Hyposmocoma kahamanoa]|uniref:uncharacterized protein LOC113235360 n=1 Tax=Hyposmocoma kahamanoa TaxID=1477025 RepID=UPI000E6D8076|nr:uncharacterized protein LOC113235360 [Hyposmocoma kahamanoa]